VRLALHNAAKCAGNLGDKVQHAQALEHGCPEATGMSRTKVVVSRKQLTTMLHRSRTSCLLIAVQLGADDRGGLALILP
jgi:hypothetical protein